MKTNLLLLLMSLNFIMAKEQDKIKFSYDPLGRIP